MTFDPMTGALVAVRLTQFAAATALLGAAFFRVFVGACLRPPSKGFDLLDDRLRRLFILAAALSLVSAIAWLLIEAAMMGGAWDDAINRDVLATVLLQTEFGRLWSVRLALAVAVLIAACLLAGARSRAGGAAILAFLSALLVASLAGTGHALAAGGANRTIDIAAQAAHLVAASVWIGGLLPLGLVLHEAKRGVDPIWLAAAQSILPRFSQAALLAVLILVLTGLIASWPLVGSFAALIQTAYGNVLLAKLALFLAMIGLAAANRRWWSPRLRAAGTDASSRRVSLHALARNVALEQVFAIGVLAAVSVLGTLPPGADVEWESLTRSRLAPTAESPYRVAPISSASPKSDSRGATSPDDDLPAAEGPRS
ncbi:MAG TPA: copper homeostasis membrane protein CopD [Roseiarcus sp.]|nr:copper homeostasis membrane protein CopD [Roseiarcus sp.]